MIFSSAADTKLSVGILLFMIAHYSPTLPGRRAKRKKILIRGGGVTTIIIAGLLLFIHFLPRFNLIIIMNQVSIYIYIYCRDCSVRFQPPNQRALTRANFIKVRAWEVVCWRKIVIASKRL